MVSVMISKKALSGGKSGGVTKYIFNEQGADASAKVGYYAAGAAPVEWVGIGAQDLGLAGPVDKAMLADLLDGKVAGQDISARGNRQHARKLGTDFTVSAPKSVSILGLAGGDAATLSDHDAAVRDAVTFIECEMALTRRGKAGAIKETTGWVVGAAARHEDARPVAGQVGMDIHTHVVLANITRRSDGTYSALDFDFGKRGVLLKTADAIYKSSLERRLNDRGVATRKTADGFEIATISQEQIDAASFRRRQIDEDLAAHGLSREDATVAQRDAANTRTRASKDQVPKTDQHYEWRRWARENGIDSDRILAAARQSGPIGSEPDAASLAVTSAAAHLSEREAVFSAHDLRLEALMLAGGNATVADIHASTVAGAGGVITLGGGKLTTQATLALESESLALSVQNDGIMEPLLSQDDASTFIETRERRQGFAYSDGQRDALYATLTSTDKTMAVIGGAGVGKSESLKGLADAAFAGGFEVVGLAPSAAAADVLKDIGADTTSTLEAYLLKPPADDKRRLIILDEAGMVSTKDMVRLQRLVAESGDRLLLTGDADQLQSVGAGGALDAIVKSGSVRIVEIREVQRQKDAGLKELAQAWSDGRVDDALQKARQYMTDVKPADKGATAMRQALAQAGAAAYLTIDEGKRAETLVLCPTNRLRQDINEKIRAGLIERGEIDAGKNQAFQTLQSRGLTKEQMTHAHHYLPGDVVRVRGEKGKIEDWLVTGVDGKSLALARRDNPIVTRTLSPSNQPPQNVYQVRALDLAPGDKIVFTAGGGRGDNRVMNNQRGVVLAGGKVRREDGSEVTLSRSQSFDRGFCVTVHKSQGQTSNRAILVDSGGGAGSAHLAYVGMTRSKTYLQILTPDKEKTVETWSVWAHKANALAAAQASLEAERQKARSEFDALHTHKEREKAARALRVNQRLKEEHSYARPR